MSMVPPRASAEVWEASAEDREVSAEEWVASAEEWETSAVTEVWEVLTEEIRERDRMPRQIRM